MQPFVLPPFKVVQCLWSSFWNHCGHVFTSLSLIFNVFFGDMNTGMSGCLKNDFFFFY